MAVDVGGSMTKRNEETYQDWYVRMKPRLDEQRKTLEYKERRKLVTKKYDKSHKEQLKLYYESNKHLWRAGELRRRYNMTMEEFDALFERQGRQCAICLTSVPTTKKGWCVDHNHNTGEVRGILCGKCNSVLGLVGDSVESLFRAIAYIRGG
jgi:hypothetical protein